MGGDGRRWEGRGGEGREMGGDGRGEGMVRIWHESKGALTAVTAVWGHTVSPPRHTGQLASWKTQEPPGKRKNSHRYSCWSRPQIRVQRSPAIVAHAYCSFGTCVGVVYVRMVIDTVILKGETSHEYSTTEPITFIRRKNEALLDGSLCCGRPIDRRHGSAG